MEGASKNPLFFVLFVFYMEKLRAFNLELRASLRYRRDQRLVPFEYDPRRGEALFVFALNPSQDRRFEPDPAAYLGPLLAGGPALGEGETADPADTLLLPRGNYFFAQTRTAPDREGLIALAADLQQELLWQRLTPSSRLYLRYLIEEQEPVFQVFRPLQKGA
jgi:hypothetical protein